MAICAEDAGAVGVVQEDKVFNKAMLIGGKFFAEDTERWIAIAGRNIAEHLIVSPIFFNDIDYVLDLARLADALGDHALGLMRTGRLEGEINLIPVIIGPDGSGEGAKVLGLGNWDERQGAVVLVGIELRGARGLTRAARPVALDIGDVDGLSGSIKHDGSREPTDGNQSLPLGMSDIEPNDGQRVLGAVGDVQGFALGIKGQGIGRRSKDFGGTPLDADAFDDLVFARIDDAKGIAGGIGDDEIATLGVQGHRRRVLADDNLGLGLAGFQIDHGDGPFIGNKLDGVHFHDRSASGRAGQVARLGTVSAPIADIELASNHLDIKRGNSHVHQSQ